MPPLRPRRVPLLKEMGVLAKAKEWGKKGGKKPPPVNALAAIPLLTPLIALALIDGGATSLVDGSGTSDPAPETKAEKAPEKARTKTRPVQSYWQQCLSSIAGRAAKAGVALATCLSGIMQPEKGTVPALAAPVG